MKKYIIFSLVVAVSIVTTSCNTGPKTIDYSNDGCHYCKMTIVDKIHGAEIVTEKGKVLKFDAAECMFNYAQDNAGTEEGNFYTNYYENPTDLMLASEATFLVNPAIPSPMGANLTAFNDKNEAEKIRANKGGTLYNWEELKNYLKK